MLVLGIDTATLVCSVALMTPDVLIAEITMQTTKNHSQRLMPQIEKLLELADTAKQDIGAVAVSIGPGSFTGLRIGLSTAKALAYAWDIPIIGIPTMAAMAYQSAVPGVLVSPLLDAQKGNVYQAGYEWREDALQEIITPRVVSFEEAIMALTTYKQPVMLMGEISEQQKQKVEEIAPKVTLVNIHAVMPRSATVAALGLSELAKGVRHDVFNVEPLYIRRSEAEVLWEKRHGGA